VCLGIVTVAASAEILNLKNLWSLLSVRASIFVGTQAVQGCVDFFALVAVSRLPVQFSATGQDSLLCYRKLL
jgi:hypothetical protein